MVIRILIGGAAGAIIGLGTSVAMITELDMIGLSQWLDNNDWAVIAPVAIAIALGALSGTKLFKKKKESSQVRARVGAERERFPRQESATQRPQAGGQGLLANVLWGIPPAFQWGAPYPPSTNSRSTFSAAAR
jgi:hypothetical protein